MTKPTATATIPTNVLLILAVGVVALSQSGNLIRISDAHPVAIAAWRLLFAGLMFLPLAGRRLNRLAALTPVEIGWLVLAGAALFFHFFAWIAAVQNTTVASASIVIAVNPLFTAIASHFFFGERITPKLVAAIVLGILGVVLVGSGDFAFDSEHLEGDALALLASIIFTVYLLTGKRLRATLDTSVYVSAIYLIAALFGFCVLLVLGQPLFAYSQRDWTCFFLMALVPTMIGHTSLNNALKQMDPGRVSMAVLMEPLLAGVVAFLVWNETVTGMAVAGYVAIALSQVILTLELAQGRP